MTKTLQIANILALIVTVVMNYLSNTGIFNDNTMATVSAEYQNFFTPSGYAFSIWGIIYIGLAAFAVYQSKGLFNDKKAPELVGKIGWLFVISCIANCLWIIAWLYDYTGASVLIMTVLLASLLGIVIRTRMEMDLITMKKIAFEWWPFALYLGWITVALIANVAAYLKKIGWDGFGISANVWTIIMIGVAGLVQLFLTWNRNLREAAMVGAWGLAAVAVANWEANKDIAFTAVAVVAVILISNGVHAYVNRGKHYLIQENGTTMAK
ncbi:tryptophan-rich sensory protein [Dyadobacter sp. CY107]|uniref:TspO/MBR family protein n=1 Tax=Dyadobacter fanqingshengii TaxID=2906443 RepID=UPI001F1735E2|nr:TspO/MBR family protein [Dyadobacter fanqingshengii]MCF2501842.1 tryptophan-rich sensory protein [Dyadobacter fanqingshengii]